MLKITEITVSAGRTFSHPHESYSNLRCDVTLKGILRDGEDETLAVKQLQERAEKFAEDHKQRMLLNIRFGAPRQDAEDEEISNPAL